MTGHGSGTAAPVEFDALPIGSQIARYKIKAVLGQGGFGITYLALDEQLGRDVAIKEYLPSFLAARRDGASVRPRSTQMADDFAWGRERFVAEARTLASLQDAPGIVRVHDFLEANGTAYMVMERAHGRTLEAVLAERTRLGPAEVAAILEPLLVGLEKVHAAGFLHRDIKPANILLRPDGTPTLIDFGASRAAVAGKTTSAMTAIFTPGYSAPEQATSTRQGPWTDIYALSATLYRAITGAMPPSAFDRVLEDEYRPLVQQAPAGFAPALLAAVDAGLAVHPADRPQSIAAWRLLLQTPPAPGTRLPSAAVHDAPTMVMRRSSLSAPSVATAAGPAPRPARPLLHIGLGVGLAVVLGGGAWFFLGERVAEPARGGAAAEIASLRQAAEDARRQAEQALASLSAERRAAEESRRQLELKASAESEARKRAEASAAALRLEEEQRRKAEEEGARRAATEKKAPVVASVAPPAVPPAWMEGSYAGSMTTSTGSGPFLSMSFSATVTVANGMVVGEVSERRCGAYRFSAPLAPSGEFAGRIRLAEDASCSTSNADFSGTIAGDFLKVEIRGQRLKTYASLKKKT